MSFFKDLGDKFNNLFKKKGDNSVSNKIDPSKIDPSKDSVVDSMIKIAGKFDHSEIFVNKLKYGKFDTLLELQKKILKKYFNERIKTLSGDFKNNADDKGRPLTIIERGIIADIIQKSRKMNPPAKSEEQEKFDKELDEAIAKSNDVIAELKEKENKNKK